MNLWSTGYQTVKAVIWYSMSIDDCPNQKSRTFLDFSCFFTSGVSNLNQAFDDGCLSVKLVWQTLVMRLLIEPKKSKINKKSSVFWATFSVQTQAPQEGKEFILQRQIKHLASMQYRELFSHSKQNSRSKESLYLHYSNVIPQGCWQISTIKSALSDLGHVPMIAVISVLWHYDKRIYCTSLASSH